MEFVKIRDVFEKDTKKAKIRCWVKRHRVLKEKVFMLLRDETAELQAVVSKEKGGLWKECKKLTIESSIIIEGSLRIDKRAPGGKELEIEKLEVVHLAEPFPIQRDFSTEFLLDVRHLWVRSKKMRETLKIRATVFEAFRKFMKEEMQAIEVQGPMFVSGMVEGGSTLFEVPYFGKRVYLTQSSQFYLEALIFSLGNVYTIAPSFRAEKSKTRRHLTEFWHAEAEFPWIGLDELTKIEERMIQYIVSYVLEKHEKELKFLGREPSTLEASASKKYKRVRYEELLKRAKEIFPEIKGNIDLGEREERALTMQEDRPLIVTHYPRELKPFYHRPDPKDERYVLCCDVLAPEGYGEIIGSGERTWKKEELLQRIKEQGLNPKDYEWYIDLRRYGSVPHAGFGLGLDRLTAWIVKAEHIRDVIPFPRTMRRYYP